MLKVWKWVWLLVVAAVMSGGTVQSARAGTLDEKAIAQEMQAAQLRANQRSAQTQSPPPPYYGTNPSFADIKAKLIAAGAKYSIPPHILFGIAFQESGWNQFRSDTRTTYHLEPDGRVGVGIMQMTVSPSDSRYARLCTDIDYNIDQGAALLITKWNATPIIGDNDKAKLENWYYAIWAYNGFICPNPNNYAPNVLAKIANGEGKWTPVTITAPDTSGCSLGRIANTPTPIHTDANYDGVIDGSTPQVGEFSNHTYYQKIIDAFTNNGGKDVVGRPTGYLYAWGPEGNSDFVQDFTDSASGSGIIIGNGTNSAYFVQGHIWEYYSSVGGVFSEELRRPTSDQKHYVSGSSGLQGWCSDFDRGRILFTYENGAHITTGEINGEYSNKGLAEGVLGFPVGDHKTCDPSPQNTTGEQQNFEGGSIYYSSHGAFAVSGLIFAKYAEENKPWSGGTGSVLGFPAKDKATTGPSPTGTTGDIQDFEGGAIYQFGTSGAHPVYGNIYTQHEALGGASGSMGFPTSDPYSWNGGTRQDFEGGYLTDGVIQYSVSGRVFKWADGGAKVGVPSATVLLEKADRTILSQTTDANGYYTFNNVEAGRVEVATYKGAINFTPLSQIVNLPTTGETASPNAAKVNFSAYRISGRIANGGGMGLAGLTVRLSGGATASVVTDANGYFSFPNLGAGSYSVAPAAQAGFVFALTSKAVVLPTTGKTASPNGTANFTRTKATGSKPSGAGS